MISSFVSQNWVTVIIFFIIALITLLHYLYEDRFIKFVSIINSREYFIDYIDKKKGFISFFNVILFLIQLGIYSLLIYKIKINFEIFNNKVTSFFYILLVLFLFFIGRYLIGRMLSSVFNLQGKQNVLSFIKFTYFSKISIFILPFIIFIYYYPYYNNLLIMINIGIVIIMFVFFYLKILLQNQKMIFSNLFYFILYLCTLEIIPLVYLYKTIF